MVAEQGASSHTPGVSGARKSHLELYDKGKPVRIEHRQEPVNEALGVLMLENLSSSSCRLNDEFAAKSCVGVGPALHNPVCDLAWVAAFPLL